jgi:hypothetical protein
LKKGYCGDDCNYCPRYLATQSGDEERFAEVAAMWRIVGWRDTEELPEKLACHGCASVKICGLGIRECVIAKGIDTCGECTDYSCQKLREIFANNEKEAAICKEKLSKEDYKLFQLAFFSKKERLDEINKNILNNLKNSLP